VVGFAVVVWVSVAAVCVVVVVFEYFGGVVVFVHACCGGCGGCGAVGGDGFECGWFGVGGFGADRDGRGGGVGAGEYWGAGGVGDGAAG
jgi:hypothetical protein